jgi:hypothetical protein
VVIEEMTIRETTQPRIANHLVGVGNIWERELPDEEGVVASRLSASVSITNPNTRETRQQFVFVGSTLSLGQERYLVVDIDEGDSELGAIKVRRIA